jgi:hypothetical protein
MPNSDTPELDSLLERKIKQLREFRQKQEGVWVIVSGAYLVSRSLIVALAKDGLLSPISAHRLMMWQTINGYLVESFFLLIDRRLDEGYAAEHWAHWQSCPVSLLGSPAHFVGQGHPFRPDPLQQHAGWFLVRVLRHQLPPECFGENNLIEMIN